MQDIAVKPVVKDSLVVIQLTLTNIKKKTVFADYHVVMVCYYCCMYYYWKGIHGAVQFIGVNVYR